jgi:CubicO group peptidase (beta-lactamase class C family)
MNAIYQTTAQLNSGAIVSIFRYSALWLMLGLFTAQAAIAQYFPPKTGTEWKTTDPASLGWCLPEIDTLYQLLQDNQTKAFIVLVDGKMVLERYFGTFSRDSLWMWASAGKTVTALAVGIAQEQGKLSIDQPTATHLGAGWSSLTPSQEQRITIRHQLTMTSGLDDRVPDQFCTDKSCLQYLAPPGTRWAYHNAPYTLLDPVIEKATGQTLNAFVDQYIKQKTGMNGRFVRLDFNNVFFSNARSMARFGLMMLNGGVWAGDTLLKDRFYFQSLTTPSQDLNPSYGYLWWLNGQEKHMIPQSSRVFDGPFFPPAPAEMYSAMGKNGQYINVVPSEKLVMVRMGDSPNQALVDFMFNNNIWTQFNQVRCTPTSRVNHQAHEQQAACAWPNPTTGRISIAYPSATVAHLYSTTGQQFIIPVENGEVSLEGFAVGIYIVRLPEYPIAASCRIVYVP